jgi:hypothetical protein
VADVWRTLGEPSGKRLGAARAALVGYAEMPGRLHGRTSGLGGEYARIRWELGPAGWTSPEPFLTCAHGDPCPDACLWWGARPGLVDFEFGGFGHALTDS